MNNNSTTITALETLNSKVIIHEKPLKINYDFIKKNQTINGNLTFESCDISIKDLVLFKKDIILKYEKDFLKSLERNDSEYLHKLSGRFDKYLLHILEEVSEFSEETFDSVYSCRDFNDEMLLELIDVISYVCSLTFLLKYESTFSSSDKVKCYDREIPLTKINRELCEELEYITNFIDTIDRNHGRFRLKSFPANLVCDCINSYMTKFCINELIGARRLFDERKWHKSVDRILSIYDLKDLYTKLEGRLTTTICSLIYLFLYLTDFNYDKFNKMYKEKGETVFNNLET